MWTQSCDWIGEMPLFICKCAMPFVAVYLCSEPCLAKHLEEFPNDEHPHFQIIDRADDGAWITVVPGEGRL